MEKLVWRNEAVDFPAIAGTQEHWVPPQVFALTSCFCPAGQNILDPWTGNMDACFLKKISSKARQPQSSLAVPPPHLLFF